MGEVELAATLTDLMLGDDELTKVAYPHCHPYPDGWFPNRLDYGYDGNFLARLLAPVDGLITYAGLFNGWDGSHGLQLRSTHDLGEGVPTNTIYWVEGIRPVVHSGEHVRCGQLIAVPALSPYGDSYGHGALGAIEFGVATPGNVGVQTNAYCRTVGAGSSAAVHVSLMFAWWCTHVLGMRGPTQTSNAGRP